MSFKKVYFPFAEGIPFNIFSDGIVIQKMEYSVWNRLFSRDDAVIISFGGYIESLLSTLIAEALNKLKPGIKLHWVGDKKYQEVIRSNGLMDLSVKLKKSIVKRYPVPAYYYDKTVFVNCLHNYTKITDIYGNVRNKRALSQSAAFQIYKNLMIPWNESYLTKLRRLAPEELLRQANLSRFGLDDRFILLVPEAIWSDKNILQFEWTPNEVRSFNSMLYRSGYKLVIVTKNPSKYYGMNAFVPSFDYSFLTYLASKATFTVSAEPEVGIASLLFDKSTVIYSKRKDHLCTAKNHKFLHSRNNIMEISDIKPYSVFEALHGKNIINDGNI